MNTQWINRGTLNSQLADKLTTVGFMLSADDPEQLRRRVQAEDAEGNPVDAVYHRVTDNDLLTSAPDSAMAHPARAEIIGDGRVRLSWPDEAQSTIYPLADALAESGTGTPPRSFALWVTEYASSAVYTSFWNRLVNYNGGPERHYARLWITGTVGERGTGADIELEAVDSWRPGRPLYIPGNQLEFPLSALRDFTGEHTIAPVEHELLDMTGPHRNIALLGTNGLTQDSFRNVNSSYDRDPPAWKAFNGYRDVGYPLTPEAQDNPDGYWQVRRETSTSYHGVEVDFGRVVEGISGVGIRVRKGYDERWFSPKRIRVAVSEDGAVYGGEANLLRSNADGVTNEVDAFLIFKQPQRARFVRVMFNGHFDGGVSAGSTIYVGNVEVYQAGSW